MELKGGQYKRKEKGRSWRCRDCRKAYDKGREKDWGKVQEKSTRGGLRARGRYLQGLVFRYEGEDLPNMKREDKG